MAVYASGGGGQFIANYNSKSIAESFSSEAPSRLKKVTFQTLKWVCIGGGTSLLAANGTLGLITAAMVGGFGVAFNAKRNSLITAGMFVGLAGMASGFFGVVGGIFDNFQASALQTAATKMTPGFREVIVSIPGHDGWLYRNRQLSAHLLTYDPSHKSFRISTHSEGQFGTRTYNVRPDGKGFKIEETPSLN